MKRKIRAISIFIVFCMLSVYIPIEAADILATDSAEMTTEEFDTSSRSQNEYETEVWSEEYIEPITSTDTVSNPGEVASTTSTPITSSIIPDGVYGLKNVGNVGLWMDIQLQRSDPGYHVQQYAQNSSSPPTDTFYRASLFKISNIPGTNQYVIRSMLNNRLSFGFSGTEVITKEIPPVDADVPLADRFTITYNTNGYVIKPYGSMYAISANNTTASGSVGAPDSYLSKRTTTDAGDRAKWSLYQYTGTNRHGTFYTYPASWTSTGIVFDSSTTLTPKTWSTVIGANTPFLQVASGYEHIASYTWDAVNFKMTLDANAVGTVRTYTKILYDGTDTVLYAGTSAFNVVPKAGRYYLRNEATKKYAGVASELMTIGTDVQQFDFDTSNRVQWLIEYVSDSGGYVKLKSNCTGLYMGVNASNSTIVEQNNTGDYILWKFETTTSGNVKAFCKATESGGAVLSTPSSLSASGANLTMSAYASDSDLKDEWSMWYAPYRFNLNNYYDEGYSVRFANAYGTAYQRVVNYNNDISERLMRLFGVSIVSQYSSFNSPADVCKEMNYGQIIFNNLHEDCTHAPIHITPTQLRNALSNGTTTTSVVIWTGHILLNNPASNSDKTRFSILITPSQTTTPVAGSNMRNNKSESEIVIQSVYSLSHEVSHQLGNPDHYCYGRNGINPCSNSNCDICVYGYANVRSCLMGNRDTGLLSQPDDYLLCTECQARIINHLEGHH